MSDTPNSQTGSSAQDASAPSKSGSEFIQELNQLGDNLCALIKSYWESEERKGFEREIAKGLEQFSKSVNDTVEQIKQAEALRQAKEGVRSVWETAHGPQVVSEVRAGMLDTLRAINRELARAAARKPAEEVTPNQPAE
ncbi:MAG: hypothetical protein RMN25_13740 [Anaerolineae bacterium]|nr:hypothetical protein [Thermoflexales bacterium]MDW8408834.1 hypothetical protein [Anaerolineae bacterium]